MSFSEAVKKASELGIAFNHEEFGFIFFDADRTNCNVKGFDTLFGIGSNSYNIKQSIVSNVAGIENKDEYKYSYARVLFDETEGMNFDIAANREVFVEDVLNYIYGKVPTEAGAYDAIIATGYSTVVLDKPLTEHDMELAEKRFDDPEYVFSDEEVKSCADTDRNGLFDFEEVMFFTKKLGKYQLITFENNEIKLPSVNTVVNALNELAYVQSGREKTIEQYGDSYDEFLNFSVLPIISDPTSVDSDGDGYNDIEDVSKLKNNIRTVKLPSDEGYFLKVHIDDTHHQQSSKSPGYYYGGYQNWFSSNEYQQNGCGSIAMANIVAYLSAVKPDFFNNDLKFNNKSLNIEYEDYMNLADDINNYMPVDADGIEWKKAFEKYTGNKVEYFGLFFHSKENLYNIIKSSLEDDRPLLIAVYNESKDFYIYEFDKDIKGNYGQEKINIKAHYMTVTGIISNDHFEHANSLIVSSYGKKYIMDFDDFYDNNHRLLFGGLGSGIGSCIYEIYRDEA